MPGKNPAEAVREYLAPLQQSLSCFGNAVIRPDGYDSGIIHTATFPSPTIELITNDQEIFHLSFVQQFTVEKSFLNWKVCTRSYMYAIDNEAGKEILAFHWHPEANPDNPVLHPHMHISPGAGYKIRSEIREIHFPTPRVAFEEFALMLIEDFGVVAERTDARKVLNGNLEKFRKFKSW